ncbi:MAG: hypothetical protein ACAH04_03860 [Methylibium sp.]|jgi:hypothetical protein|nr:hypothetical protein [Methyloceanibacter sp.]
MKRTPQQFENDYFPGWAVSKKHASPEMLERLERFIAEKRALIARVKWWRSPDLRQRHVVVVPPQQN